MNVSVIIPAFNAAAYLPAALDSVLSQSYRDLEIIVVNDGSTDHTAIVLDGYGDRIRVIRQSNSGQCAAANAGFAASTGALIKFFDADDIMHAQMIERQVAKLAGRMDAIAMGEWHRFYGEAPEEVAFPPLSMYRDAKPVDWMVQEWCGARPMMQCGLWLIPRGLIECRGLWDERLSLINDFEYFARLLVGASDLLYAPGARMYYRSGLSGSLSGQASRKAVESAFLSLTLGTRHLLAAEDSARTRRVCANILQDFDYTYYPDHADLREQARRRVIALGGSDLEPDGPPGFHSLRRVTGWKIARRIQRLSEQRGWNGAARARTA
ncbi:glycosyltransferase family A protein [Bosea sp. 124]|uniref:glycosyltransferase family 2 protein n=1 Tax=Bosea sp. 124 TaxID=2135642 RepID=UPI0015E63EC8|nr:glycosyltransferase family A protein [Bosea sp. 124]